MKVPFKYYQIAIGLVTIGAGDARQGIHQQSRKSGQPSNEPRPLLKPSGTYDRLAAKSGARMTWSVQSLFAVKALGPCRFGKPLSASWLAILGDTGLLWRSLDTYTSICGKSNTVSDDGANLTCGC